MLRILILNYEYPPLGGGAGVVTQHLAERMAERGHKVHVVTTWFPGEPEFQVQGNLTIVRLKSRRKKSFQSNPFEMYAWMRHAFRYFKQLPDEKMFDVCLANFTLPGGPVARYIQKRWEIPYVILSHGHDIPWFAPKQMFLWHLLFYPFIKRITLQSQGNILLTPELKLLADSFLGAKYKHKNLVIPNGLIVDKFRLGFDSPNEDLHVLFVGRMVAQKDPLGFVKACQLLNNMNIPVKFTMVGDGPLMDAVERQIVKLGINNIELLGKVSQYQVYKVYEKAHVVVAPSREEAMSMVILEAVSRGIYVVTTKVSGNNELILEDVNGDFVNVDQPKEMAHQVAKFYFEKYLKKYRYPDYLVNDHYDKYSWESVVDRYFELFYQSINKISNNSPVTKY